MSHIALILEGLGDIEAYPALIGKVGQTLHQPYFAPQPIRAGGAERLRQPGQLERFVEMAATRSQAEAVLVAVDLDDGCCVEWHEEFVRRSEEIADRYAKPVRVCFAIREFECWFLEDLDHLRAVAPEYDWRSDFSCANPSAVRGAKEALQAAMKARYKASTDQAVLAKKLDAPRLYQRSRSFRKFVRGVTGLDYVDLNPHFGVL